MNKTQQAFAVTAICLSIIMAGALIAYRPGIMVDNTKSTTTGLSFPTGVGPSLGYSAYTGQTETPQQKTISLSGAGTASGKADEAKVTLGVQTEDTSASEAIQDNADLMSAVIQAVKALGFSDEDIQTVGYSVSPNYNWEIRQVIGYTVSNMIQITISDLKQVGPVIDAAGAAGANVVNGISFELSDAKMQELKNQAYVAALIDAQDKANLIADTMKLTISGVQSVTENSYVPARAYYDMAEVGAVKSSVAPTPIIEGSLTVTVNVYIIYLIE
jgi:uncharacterized protein YggE